MKAEDVPDEQRCEIFSMILSLHGMKWAILVKRSTTTHIVSQFCDKGNPTMKSILMDDHGVLGISRGLSWPCVSCLDGFARIQLGQFET